MKVVLASNNNGKILEFTELFKPFHLDIVPQGDLGVGEVEETGLTFIENALIKARHASQVTGLPAIGDDSGLAVAALNGAPGIYSARYAGHKASQIENINKLLAALSDTPDDKRQASFHCTLVFITHAEDPVPLICDGTWSGTILREPRGIDEFGYNPIFYDLTMKKSAAEMSLEDKNKISHRGKALRCLLEKFPDKS